MPFKTRLIFIPSTGFGPRGKSNIERPSGPRSRPSATRSATWGIRIEFRGEADLANAKRRPTLHLPMDDESELLALRRARLETWREMGVDPFGEAFPGTETCG